MATNKKGSIGVTSENIFPVIKKFLYSDHDIFLREVVANAVDATEKLKTLSSAGAFKGELGNLKVEVILNEAEKTITIRDYGIGMTAEEVEKYINQIALSSAEEFLEKYKDDKASIIGHFGLGFYSAFMVSKKVEIITKSWQEGAEAVHWSCTGNPEYEMVTCEKDERGTDIIMHIDDESSEFISKERIQNLLNKYCQFLTIPIIFGKKQEWKDGKMQDTTEDNQINDTNPAWTKKPSELKDEDYIKFYHDLYPMTDDPMFWIHLNVDYPFNLTGILYFPKVRNQVDLERNKIRLFCNQVYVTDEVKGIVPEFLTLLHGVIDSPDIPLNVSRSYLQSDAEVKKISGYITKKVSDKLEEIFNKDRKSFEEKWPSLKLFIEFGMLTDEKFYERAKSYFLFNDVQDQTFTLEEYKTLVEAAQKDKDGKIVYLYATNKETQWSYIKAAQDKGYNVLFMDGQLENHLISHLEQKLENIRFARVDSDTIDRLIPQEGNNEVDLDIEQQEVLRHMAESRLPQDNKRMFQISFTSGKETEAPMVITQGEFMRRMQEMSKLQPGMSFYGEMPESYNVAINVNHPLVKRLLSEEKNEAEAELSPLREKLVAAEKQLSACEKLCEGKKEDEIPIEDKEAKENAQKKANEARKTFTEAIKTYGLKNNLIGQMIDLALLSSSMLKGEALDRFINRSLNML